MDLGYAIMGSGQIANAWGQYKVGKEANKLAKEQLEYEKQKDANQSSMLASAQNELNDGFSDVFTPKKKKTTDVATDIATAYDTTTPSTTLSA